MDSATSSELRQAPTLAISETRFCASDSGVTIPDFQRTLFEILQIQSILGSFPAGTLGNGMI